MTNPDVIAPTIHLKGTGARSLIGGLYAAWIALEAACDALKQAAPKSRDYYLEPGRFEKAVEQHRARMASINAVQASLREEMEAIKAQC